MTVAPAHHGSWHLPPATTVAYRTRTHLQETGADELDSILFPAVTKDYGRAFYAGFSTFQLFQTFTCLVNGRTSSSSTRASPTMPAASSSQQST